jgi:hypothetical protein
MPVTRSSRAVPCRTTHSHGSCLGCLVSKRSVGYGCWISIAGSKTPSCGRRGCRAASGADPMPGRDGAGPALRILSCVLSQGPELGAKGITGGNRPVGQGSYEPIQPATLRARRRRRSVAAGRAGLMVWSRLHPSLPPGIVHVAAGKRARSTPGWGRARTQSGCGRRGSRNWTRDSDCCPARNGARAGKRECGTSWWSRSF